MISFSMYKRMHFYAGNLYRFLTIPIYQKNIEIENVVSIFGVSFVKGGRHHILKTLEEYDNFPEITYSETSMYKYLKGFCPTSICELVNNKNRFECDLPLFLYPWGTFREGEYTTNKNPLTSRFCGPSSDEFIKDEFNRTVMLYNHMKTNGYSPWSFGNTFIGGTLLVSNEGNERFIVLQGNHRMAILSHLGFRNIKVREVKGYLKVIKESDVEKWPLVKLGMCTKEFALNVFNHFFNSN